MELKLEIYDRSITVKEHRDLRHAVGRAAGREAGDEITHLSIPGAPASAAIVPADLVEYALRHGYGR